jgi:Na+-translocating ferredoxin:NAD+ oxidoreductase RNF subunit RnfB
MNVILITLGFSALLAFALGITLGWFKEKFKVERDPRSTRCARPCPASTAAPAAIPAATATPRR